jgi:hypothetical protein
MFPEKRAIDLPCVFRFISPNEQGLVAGHHIQQESLIRFWKLAEDLSVPKMESLSFQLDLLTRGLDLKMEIEAFLRLKSHHKFVGGDFSTVEGTEELDWRTAEAHGNLRQPARQTFSRAQYKGNPLPSPIRNFEANSRVRLCPRVISSEFLQVTLILSEDSMLWLQWWD